MGGWNPFRPPRPKPWEERLVDAVERVAKATEDQRPLLFQMNGSLALIADTLEHPPKPVVVGIHTTIGAFQPKN